MKVDLLDRSMVDSDLGVVNAARCSFDKESTWAIEKYIETDEEYIPITKDIKTAKVLREADRKLIAYLAKHNHWTPFAHAQEVFKISPTEDKELLTFFTQANLSGFEWYYNSSYKTVYLRGSLYAWLSNAKYLPQNIEIDILTFLLNKYPVSTSTLLNEDNLDVLKCLTTRKMMYVEHVKEPLYEALKPYTLRIHCPIFVKRQLETHRRNFVMTDIEDFSQNEVSRRYIDTPPEIYHPEQWRLQAKDKKQGSSEETLEGVDKTLVNSNYNHHTHNSIVYYNKMNSLNISHEQSRMILPLSTYTTFWWTGSLKSWQRMFTLRLDPHAQSETRDIAQMCYEAIDIQG